MAVLNRAKEDARGVIANAKHKLSAIESAAVTVGEKVGMMKEVLLEIVAAWELQNSRVDALDSSFTELLRGIKKLQMEIDRLEAKVTTLERNAKLHEGRTKKSVDDMRAVNEQLSIVRAFMERQKGDIFMGECGLGWARLLQDYTFEGDPRAGMRVPMFVSDIIKEASADPLHSDRCCQVLAFAQQKVGLTRRDLEEVDEFLREDRRWSGDGKPSEKRALGVDKLLQYANAAYDELPEEHRQVTQLIHLLNRFSPQGKPLDASLSVFKRVIEEG